MYQKLIEYHKQGLVSFKHVVTFNMDEYVGIPRDHKESYHTYMWQNFFSQIDIDPKNVNLLDGNAKDLQKECNDFEAKIRSYGGVELFVGGECCFGTSEVLYMLQSTSCFCICIYCHFTR